MRARITAAEYTSRLVGQRVGSRTVRRFVEVDRSGPGRHNVLVVEVVCDCGAARVMRIQRVKDIRPTCTVCSEKKRPPRARTPRMVALAEAGDECPEIWRGSDDQRQLDAAAELTALCGPMSRGEVGALLGLTRERVRQIEHVALAKLRLRFGRECREMLRDLDNRPLTLGEQLEAHAPGEI